MAREFRAAFDGRTDLIRDQWIYDEGVWVVWAAPLRTPNKETGTTSVSLGGPFLVLHGMWSDQQALAEKIAAVLTEHLEAQPSEWRSTDELRASTPKKGEAPHVDVRSTTTYRWLPYKPDGARQMHKTGRWQIATEYGWTNAEMPAGAEWKPNLPLTGGASK